jgi:uncharacterized protein (DUF305 family)
MKRARALSATLAAIAAAVVLAACGNAGTGTYGQNPPPGAPPPGTTSPAPHNDADVTFAQGMIPHHSQAIEMARLAPRQARSEHVKNLARQIEAAQGPEIETMKGWLTSWGAPESPGMPGMDHGGGMDMSGGMMSPQEMQQLQAPSGAEFDRMFLTMMIKHHEGAIATARTELQNGQFPPAKQLAQQIIDTQKTEIDTMKGLLQQH